MDRTPLVRKYVVVGIILLFVGACIIPAIAQKTEQSQSSTRGNWLYVGGGGPFTETKNRRFSPQKYYENFSSSYNAYENGKQNYQFNDISSDYPIYRCSVFNFNNSSTIYVPDDYPTIQLAINNSSPGDTIIVRDGTYVENIIVNKPLILQSEHGYSYCTIEAKSNKPHVITITSDYVSIVGLKIQGVSELGRAGKWHSQVNHTTIVGNWLLLNDFATFAQYSNYNSIHDNVIGSSGFYDSWGIRLRYTNNNSIFNNDVSGLDTYAVALELNSSSNTVVYNNNLGGQYDLGLLSSHNNIFKNNTMYVGMSWAHIYMTNSSNNIFQNNTFTQGSNYLNDGVEIYDSSNYNQFLNNTFNRVGIVVFTSYHNIFNNNTVKSKPLLVLENITDYTVNYQVGQLVLVNCSRIVATNIELSGINVGLELFNVKDSIIDNVSIYSNNYEGIYSVFSENISFRNLIVEDNYCGISVWRCRKIEIAHSVSKPNFEVDFSIDESPDTFIHNISITQSIGNWAMKIYNSNNVTMCHNLISHHSNTALRIYNTSNSRIFENNFTNNYYPLQIEDCNNLSIFRNTINNIHIGLGLITCHNCKIEENNFGNCMYSCIVSNGLNMNMKNNTFINSKSHFAGGRNVTIEENDFTSSNLEVDSVTGVFIFKNIFLNNSQFNLSSLFSSSQGNATVKYNLFQNNSCALSISSSKGISITTNNFIKNEKNILLSKECFIRNIFSFISYKQVWMNNYWDDWNHNKNYAIQGNWTFNIGFFYWVFPIIKIHYIEYDPAPAEEPYDIPGMS
jgi:hypothetical protein